MTPEKVIYTDGRDVTVTDSALKVKNTSYNLNGITKLTLWTIHPDRWPAIVLLLLGLAAAVLGFMKLIPADINLQTNEGIVSGNTLALWVGIALAVALTLALALPIAAGGTAYQHVLTFISGMLIARVIGTVVSTQKEPTLEGLRLLVCQPVNAAGEKSGAAVVAADAVGSPSDPVR